MHVIVVTPLIRGTHLESLSYFSSVPYDIGSFVQVPIRGKNQSAIVTAVRSATASKTALKAATFSLRKLPQQPDSRVLPAGLRTTAEKLAEVYPATMGALLYQLLPPDVRNGSRPYPESDNGEQHQDTVPQLITARTDERYDSYRSVIRSEFAKQQSVVMVVPTASYVAQAASQLSAGIKDRVITLSPLMTKSARDKAYAAIEDTGTAKLLICTSAYAYIERADCSTIIVEHSGSSHYVARTRPYLDQREGLKQFAKACGRQIILGDTVPLTEDEHKRREDIYTTYAETTKRLAFAAPLTIVTQRDKALPDVPFRLFSEELGHAVERALESKGRVFLFAARRGLAPVVACIDCSHIFRCPDSGTPYSLMRTYNAAQEEERWFVSSTSGRRVKASDTCPKCGSWRLRERGIGLQQVADEWKEQFPHTDLTVIDQATAKTPKEVHSQTQAFFKKQSGVLIGTQVVLPYLQQGVAVSAIVSLDAARSIPTWRADESLFRLLLTLRENSSQEVLVQTRTETDNLLTYATRGAIERFYDDELELRRMVQYPPLCTFILLTWAGSAKTTNETEALITNTLRDEQIQCYNHPHSTQTKAMRHSLIRLNPEDKAAYSTTLDRLRSLPPYVKIEVNPERIV
jgi:primosomal protein N'